MRFPVNIRLIENDGLQHWLAAILQSGRRLFVPKAAHGLTFYREATTTDEVKLLVAAEDLRPAKPYYSLKQLLFPISEPVLQYSRRNGEVTVEDAVPADEAEVVVFGATPCDAAAVRVLDQVFLAPEADPFYAHRRARTVIIGLSCTHAQPECFCTAVGLSPTSSEGCDLLFTPIGVESRTTEVVATNGKFLVEIFTPAGESLINLAEGCWKEPQDEKQAEVLLKQRDSVRDRVESEMIYKHRFTDAVERLRADFESPEWEGITRKCLGCGVCSFVCPTCHCFDLTDEYNLNAGCRYKNWDSCCFAQFTLHASGHNPRPTEKERYRQRVMHKFCYFPETTGMNMCVGCGRCTKFCPVGMDIAEVRCRWQ
jgi:ferredoxin